MNKFLIRTCLRKFNEEEAEQRFINDIKNAQKNISVYIPGIFTTDWKRIIKELNNNNKVRVSIFIEERLVSEIKKNNFESNIEISSKKVIMNPITIIDNLIIWYGKPITRTDFISQKNDCHVYYRPIFRFEGDNTAKKIKALLQN